MNNYPGKDTTGLAEATCNFCMRHQSYSFLCHFQCWGGPFCITKSLYFAHAPVRIHWFNYRIFFCLQSVPSPEWTDMCSHLTRKRYEQPAFQKRKEKCPNKEVESNKRNHSFQMPIQITLLVCRHVSWRKIVHFQKLPQ